MMSFNSIYEAALDRVGSRVALHEMLPVSRSVNDLKSLSDAYCLSNMSRRIFQAGLNRRIIDNKWPAFEGMFLLLQKCILTIQGDKVFHRFDIDAIRALSDEALEKLMEEKRIVRHWGKIQSVRHNAQAIYELNEEQESFVAYLADWPTDNIVGLWDVLKNRFKQLGGASGPYFLRRVKKDTFLLTQDVIKALMRWGAIDEVPKNQRQKQQVQVCMNEWHEESQRSYCQISMILAKSVD
ncbi:MAG: DNA-3-methyladenine glycosylase I [Proteobacteria bacterium]|nr:DNA-3-methyladenine glycosylase I [Pseudomonadota bacterium]